MSCFYLKHRDTGTGPTMKVTILNPDKTVYDLTGVDSVTLHALLPSGSVFSRLMEIDANPMTGIVRYTFLATDWTDPTTPLVVGHHLMEFELNGTTTGRMTVPTGDYDTLRIVADLGQVA